MNAIFFDRYPEKTRPTQPPSVWWDNVQNSSSEHGKYISMPSHLKVEVKSHAHELEITKRFSPNTALNPKKEVLVVLVRALRSGEYEVVRASSDDIASSNTFRQGSHRAYLISGRVLPSSGKIESEIEEVPTRFVPSLSLAKFLREALTQSGIVSNVDEAAQEMIRNSVLGLFNVLALSVRDSGKEPPYPLAENREFAEAIKKALLHRLPLKVSQAGSFFAQLHFEVSLATKKSLIRGPFWRVKTDLNGALHLEVDSKAVSASIVSPKSTAEVINVFED